MTAMAILEAASQRGILLEARGGELRYRAPRGSLTPELRETLRQHKAEILAVLQSEQPGGGMGLCPGPEKCKGCYSVGVIDGRERYIHPPKGKPIEWEKWTRATDKLQ